MLFINRKIIVARGTAEGSANGVDGGCHAHSFNSERRRSAQGIVAAEGIISINNWVRMIDRSTNRRKVDQYITAADACYNLPEIACIGNNKVGFKRMARRLSRNKSLTPSIVW